MSYQAKKIIGTSVFVLLVGGILLVGGAIAQAEFLNAKDKIVLDGVVSSVGAGSFVILTSGTDPVTVDVVAGTVFVGGALSPGYNVKVWGVTDSGSIEAKMVKKFGSGAGYGVPGSPVIVKDAEVLSKTANSFTVDSGVAIVTFQVTASTTFFKTTFAALIPGDMVTVIGQDSGSSFVATTVLKL